MTGKIMVTLCVLAFWPAAAPAAEGTTKASTRGNPNRMICRTDLENGSRVKKTRTCHTAAEWAELRRQMKANVERIQNNRPTAF